MNELYEILKNIPLFSDLNEAELTEAVSNLCGDRREFEKNEYIFGRGERLSHLGILLRGRAHIIKEDFWGNAAILTVIGEGEIFGEAFVCSGASTEVAAAAVERSDILFLDFDRLLKMELSGDSGYSKLLKDMLVLLAKKNVFLTSRIEHLSRRSLREKVLSYLSEQSERAGSESFTIPFNRQQMAEYLSSDRSALSAVLCKLRDEGTIEFHKNRFKLLDENVLNRT